MKCSAILILALAASAAVAAPGGQLRTLERGNYQCATPGVAGSQAVVLREELGFKVINGSSYRRGEVRGTYLHTGETVIFTSGSLKGERFRRMSQSTLQQLNADYTLSDLRCVRLGR